MKHSPVKKTAVAIAKKSIASPTPKKLSLKFSTPSLASGNEKQVPAISSMPKLTLKLARPVMDTPTKVLEPKMQKIKLKFGASLASKAEDGEQSKTPAKGEIAGPQIKAPTKAPGEAPKEEAAVVTPLKLKFKLKPKPE